MASIVVITGCPGSGKTTIARRLADEQETGIHLQVDDFFDGVAHPIDPTKPESHRQNEIVIKAASAAASVFAAGDYRVFVDGIIGPWFIQTFVQALPPSQTCHYVILTAPLDETLRRALARQDADKFGPEGVRHMHNSFSNPGDYEKHRLATDGLSVPETVSAVRGAIASNAYVVTSTP
jgi:tRNA uridine 5-carbamoylmethylation protein Kti12